MIKIILIAAIGKRGELGLNNQLLWHIPDDLKHFKETTKGKLIVMGANTFRSIGRVLPNRKTAVLSTKLESTHPDMVVFTTINDLLKYADSCRFSSLYICGGAKIYNEFINKADELLISHVEWSGEADTFFPTIDSSVWQEVSSQTHDEGQPIKWRLVKYCRA